MSTDQNLSHYSWFSGNGGVYWLEALRQPYPVEIYVTYVILTFVSYIKMALKLD